MTVTLVRRLARLEAAAAAQGDLDLRHLTLEQLQDLIAALERQIAADDADMAE